MVEIREESRAALERKLDVAPFEEKFRLGWGGAQVARACGVSLRVRVRPRVLAEATPA